jgi:hypothetical protein
MEMPVDATLVASVAAILVMLYALWRVIRLRGEIPGGVVGRTWNILIALVVLFAVGYVAMPLLGELSAEVLRLVVSLIFLFGAIYVVITIGLIHRIIRVLSE